MEFDRSRRSRGRCGPERDCRSRWRDQGRTAMPRQWTYKPAESAGLPCCCSKCRLSFIIWKIWSRRTNECGITVRDLIYFAQSAPTEKTGRFPRPYNLIVNQNMHAFQFWHWHCSDRFPAAEEKSTRQQFQTAGWFSKLSRNHCFSAFPLNFVYFQLFVSAVYVILFPLKNDFQHVK